MPMPATSVPVPIRGCHADPEPRGEGGIPARDDEPESLSTGTPEITRMPSPPFVTHWWGEQQQHSVTIPRRSEPSVPVDARLTAPRPGDRRSARR